MGKNKTIYARREHEIPCYGIAVAYDQAVMAKIFSSDEADQAEIHAYLNRILSPSLGNESVLGVHNSPQGIIVLVKVTEDGSDKGACQEILAEYERLGFKARLTKDIVYADGNMHYTHEVAKHWKSVLAGLEQDIGKWQDEHPYLAKKAFGA